MTDDVRLRDAQPHEAPLILDVWRAAYNEDDLHGELRDVQRVIADPKRSRLLVAEAGEKIVGTLIVAFDGWRARSSAIMEVSASTQPGPPPETPYRPAGRASW